MLDSKLKLVRVIEQIRNRELHIQADIMFLPRAKNQLKIIMSMIAPTGVISYLSQRDVRFSYCNERNVWYGSETLDISPLITMEELQNLINNS